MARGDWLAVASGDHVARGRGEGFMQVCHGKRGPLQRVAPGDGIVYYSPTRSFGGKDRLRAFTAIGVVRPGTPYQVGTATGFQPFRRDVDWEEAGPVPVETLIDRLALTADRQGWGYRLRFGLLKLEPGDFAIIREAMTSRAGA